VRPKGDGAYLFELPKNATGKAQKFVLREREWSGREQRIN
jgi:fatty-acyl-CoA synthase